MTNNTQTNAPTTAPTPQKSANRPAFEAVITVTSENGDTTWKKSALHGPLLYNDFDRENSTPSPDRF